MVTNEDKSICELFNQRLKDIEDNIKKEQQLLKDFEEKKRLEENPRQIILCDQQIENLKKSIYSNFQEHEEIKHKLQKLVGQQKRISQDWGWGDAPDISGFVGRKNELETLKKWILDEHCRLVAIHGIGGIGKTSLSVKLSKEIQENFDYVIWRSFKNGLLPIKYFLADLIKIFPEQPEMDWSEQKSEQKKSIEPLFSSLMDCFKKYRCLLILDNTESILPGEQTIEHKQEEYNLYTRLLKTISETHHQSCLLITCRETPSNLIPGVIKPIRFYELQGLDDINDGRNIIESICGSVSGTNEEWEKLIRRVNGHPFLLELTAKLINQLSFTTLSECLNHDNNILDNPNAEKFLQWHFERLSEAEKEILYWLIINTQPTSIEELKADLLFNDERRKVEINLCSLQEKIPLEKIKNKNVYTLQSILKEYVLKQFIASLSQEIQSLDIKREGVLNRFALMKATSKDYIREQQIRIIVKPLQEKIIDYYGNQTLVENHLKKILDILREKMSQYSGYAAGNILNLLCQMNSDLSQFDFSRLTIWQAFLGNISVQSINCGVNLTEAKLDQCIFLEIFNEIFSVALNNPKTSDESNLLAAGDHNGRIHIWKVKDNFQCIKQWTIEAHSSVIWSIAFSPDNQILASASDDGWVRLWNVENGQNLCEFEQPDNFFTSVAFDSDGQLLATGLGKRDGQEGSIKVWQIEKENNNLMRLKLREKWSQKHNHPVHTVSFSPTDTCLLASGSSDKTVKIWNRETGECLGTLTEYQDAIYSVAFSPDGKMLASAGKDKTIRLWDMKNSNYPCIKSLKEHTAQINSLTFSKDKPLLISADEKGVIRVWDLHEINDVKNDVKVEILQKHDTKINSVAFSPDSQLLVSGSSDRSINLWQLQVEDQSLCLNTLRGYTVEINSLAFSHDSQFLVSGGNDKQVRIWNLETGKYKSLTEHKADVHAVTFHPQNNDLVASGGSGNDPTVRLWNLQTKINDKLQTHYERITSVAFSPNGKFLASRSHDQRINVWSFEQNQPLNSDSLQVYSSGYEVASVAFSHDNQYIASGSSNQVKLWKIQQEQEQEQVIFSKELPLPNHEGHTAEVYAVAFNPQPTAEYDLASAGEDTTIRLWKTQTGESKYLGNHTMRVSSLAFHPGGTLLASGSNDGDIKIWNVDTAKCETVAHSDKRKVHIYCIAFSPNGQYLASCGVDGFIQIWQLQRDTLETPLKITHWKSLRMEKPLEGMNITGLIGLTEPEKAVLIKELGAISR